MYRDDQLRKRFKYWESKGMNLVLSKILEHSGKFVNFFLMARASDDQR